ncbi:hypothetical protein DBR17_10660 [Sphingomonas sp. HMWF008]|nr:hypothetical protein DBR17_10660 [Sphingomonas sp. HMWF008]
MTPYPNSPQILKAALISLGPTIPVPRLIMLQYNPAELTRQLHPDFEKTGDTPTGTNLLAGPAVETIQMTARISAVDQLESNDATAMAFGIHPQLATLEMMLFPTTSSIVQGLAQMMLGVLEIVPPESPLTIFVWGPQRVLPVQITSYSVTETMHDTRLNPIDASVTMDMKVLTYQDFSPEQTGFYLYLANLAERELMSTLGTVQSGASIIAGALSV